MINVGIQYTSPIDVALIMTMSPVAIILLSSWIYFSTYYSNNGSYIDKLENLHLAQPMAAVIIFAELQISTIA